MGDGAISHPLRVHDRLSSSRNIDAQWYQDNGRAEHGVNPRVVRGHVPCDVISCPTENYSRFTFESGTIWCHAPQLLCAISSREQVQQTTYYLMTSSARASTVGGTVKPTALAAIRLITSDGQALDLQKSRITRMRRPASPHHSITSSARASSVLGSRRT
jgi:hypothetical protein